MPSWHVFAQVSRKRLNFSREIICTCSWQDFRRLSVVGVESRACGMQAIPVQISTQVRASFRAIFSTGDLPNQGRGKAYVSKEVCFLLSPCMRCADVHVQKVAALEQVNSYLESLEIPTCPSSTFVEPSGHP